MSNYFKAYRELVKSDLIDESIINKHVDQYLKIDQFLPSTQSFFLICELGTGSYPFIGSQQEIITGYSNKLFRERGMAHFIDRLHP